jgi:hypothetical protein
MDQGRGISNRPITQRPERTRSFIVRVWFEPSTGGPSVLRGTIAELGGGTIGAFSTVDEMSALLIREINR